MSFWKAHYVNLSPLSPQQCCCNMSFMLLCRYVLFKSMNSLKAILFKNHVKMCWYLRIVIIEYLSLTDGMILFEYMVNVSSTIHEGHLLIYSILNLVAILHIFITSDISLNYNRIRFLHFNILHKFYPTFSLVLFSFNHQVFIRTINMILSLRVNCSWLLIDQYSANTWNAMRVNSFMRPI